MKVTLHPPFYLLKSPEICWKCRSPTDAIAFAAGGATPDNDEDELDEFSPMILKDIEEAPAPFLIAAATTGVDFRKRFSKAAGLEYFMNHCSCDHCSCGAPFGDFFLHNEPGHAFFPIDEREAAMIHIREIAWDVDMECDCDFAGWSSLSPFDHGTPKSRNPSGFRDKGEAVMAPPLVRVDSAVDGAPGIPSDDPPGKRPVPCRCVRAGSRGWRRMATGEARGRRSRQRMPRARLSPR